MLMCLRDIKPIIMKQPQKIDGYGYQMRDYTFEQVSKNRQQELTHAEKTLRTMWINNGRR